MKNNETTAIEASKIMKSVQIKTGTRAGLVSPVSGIIGPKICYTCGLLVTTLK